jgi:RNA polymerase sigma factor FliA
LRSRSLHYRIESQDPGLSSHWDGTESRDEMIMRYAPLVKYVAHRLAMRLPPHISVDDLMSAGVIGLMDALTKFDAGKNVQFKTYAEFRIRGAILDELRALDWVPRSVRQKATEIERTCADLERKKGRPAEDEEVAEALGISLDRYYRLMKEVGGVSLVEAGGNGDKESPSGDEETFEQIGDEGRNDPFDALSINELKGAVARAIDELTPKEKTVISLYYYDELTLKEIGEVLGFTESRICQIHTKAILKLRGKIKRYGEGAL